MPREALGGRWRREARVQHEPQHPNRGQKKRREHFASTPWLVRATDCRFQDKLVSVREVPLALVLQDPEGVQPGCVEVIFGYAERVVNVHPQLRFITSLSTLV